MKTYKLGDVCVLSKGKTITRATTIEGDVPVIGGGLGPTYFHNIANRNPPVITISASGANAGFVNYWNLPIWASDCTTITEKYDSPASIGYIYKYLESRQEFINTELRRGSAQPHVYPSDIADLEIPLPSLEKQLEIVAKLDATFTEIDLFDGNLRQIDEEAGRLLQSLLSASFTFSALKSEPSHPSSNEKLAVEMASLKDICLVFGDGDWIESKDQSDSGIRLIQTGNVGQGVFKDRIEKARWISEDTFKRLRCTEIGEGDVLISRLPDPVGRACLLPALEHKAITAVDCSIVRFDENRMDPKFFVYYSQSPSYEAAIAPLVSGSTRQRISRENLGTIKVPLPPLRMQREIVEKLNSAFTEIELLRSQFTLERAYCLALRQSILSSAFTEVEGVA